MNMHLRFGDACATSEINKRRTKSASCFDLFRSAFTRSRWFVSQRETTTTRPQWTAIPLHRGPSYKEPHLSVYVVSLCTSSLYQHTSCPQRDGPELRRLGCVSRVRLVPGSARRGALPGVLQHRADVSPGVCVSFRDKTPLPARSRERSPPPAAQHGSQSGRGVPAGSARHKRQPQCGEFTIN